MTDMTSAMRRALRRARDGVALDATEAEILLADFVDGTLRGEAAHALETHLAGCPACAALARDSAEAVAFMGRRFHPCSAS